MAHTDERLDFLMATQAVKLLEKKSPTIRLIDITLEPSESPTAPFLVDETGHALDPPRETFMQRADRKVAEKMEVSKGMLALVALVPAFAMMLFSWGSGFVGIVQDNTVQKQQMQQMQTAIAGIQSDVHDLKGGMEDLKNKEAYRAGVDSKPKK